MEQVAAEHEARGRVDPTELAKAIALHLEGISVTGSDLLRRSLESIHTHARRDALDRAGFRREARLAKVGQTREQRREELRRSYDLAFRGVTSLPADAVERIRARLVENLGLGRSTEQVLRAILEEETEGLDASDPGALRAAIRRVWERTRHDLQRVVRSESINAYTRVQLREWRDRGIRQVYRRAIDDDRTCALCRELARPGNNVYEIDDLIALDYPVSQDPATGEFRTHPQDRCWFQARIDDVWAEVEGIEADLFSDIARGEARAADVPIDSRRAVERALREHADTDVDVRFVPSIVELPEWRAARLGELRAELGDRATVVLASEVALDAVTEWEDRSTGASYVARQARDYEHMSAPVARAAARRLWDSGEVPHGRPAELYRDRKAQAGATLEENGYRLFGGEPFVSDVAAESPRDFFVEVYAAYVVQPYVLRTTDPETYGWLASDVFGGREFMARGGLK